MSAMILTPTRNDRPVMEKHCMEQIKRFHGSFSFHCSVNFPPVGKGFDLKDRIFEGYKSAIENKIDWVIIVENDDFYPATYLHEVLLRTNDADFIGCEFTHYYNIKTRTHERLYHPNRSSLFNTAFRVSAMVDFKWHLAHKLFIDIDIWQHARRYRRAFVDAGAIGIKGHGEGLAGGKGHTMKLKDKDPDLKWLASKVDSHSLEFYKSLAL